MLSSRAPLALYTQGLRGVPVVCFVLGAKEGTSRCNICLVLAALKRECISLCEEKLEEAWYPGTSTYTVVDLCSPQHTCGLLVSLVGILNLLVAGVRGSDPSFSCKVSFCSRFIFWPGWEALVRVYIGGRKRVLHSSRISNRRQSTAGGVG